MKVLVLLSAGMHPISRRPMLPDLEARAIRLALALDPDAGGLHAGPAATPVRACLGHGLGRMHHCVIPAGDDPLPSLEGAVASLAPDIVLAGRCGAGGEDTGLIPYALAHALGRPLVADAVAIAKDGDALTVTQTQARGARAIVRLRPPVVITVHPAAPPAAAFAHGAARRGVIVTQAGVSAPVRESPWAETPYRPRPKRIGGQDAAANLPAAERLRAVIAPAAGESRRLEPATPQEAAREILAFLRSRGLLTR